MALLLLLIEKLKNGTRYVIHCILPLLLLFSVTPVFFTAWFSSQLFFSFFKTTRELFIWLDVFFWSWYQRLVLCFVENWPNTEIYLYGDVPNKESTPRRESVVFICNHQCAFDWIIGDIVAVRHGCLGNLRYVLKNSLRHIPLFGYFFKLHGCIYVQRGGHDVESYCNQLKNLAKRGIYWLVIFPEGTRFQVGNKKVLDNNRGYADKYKLPIFDLVLTPKHRGFYTAFQALTETNNCEAVYDATIAYEPPDWKPDGNQPSIPSMDTYLMGATRRLHIHIKRIPVADIPKEEEQFLSWLCDRFRVKNEILSKFYSTGGALVGDQLPMPSRLSPYRETLPYVIAAVGLALLFLANEMGHFVYIIVAIFGVLFTLAWMALVPDRFSMFV